MKNITCLLGFIILSFISCSGTIKSDNNHHSEQGKIAIIRFDKDIYSYIQQPDSEKEKALVENYPLLLPAFGQIAMKTNDPSTFFPQLREYFANKALLTIYQDAMTKYNDVSTYEDKLTTVNALIEENFSGKQLPQLAMHVSGFRANVIIVNNIISLSIDKYLGSNYTAYAEFFQPYERMQMQPEDIVKDYIKAWLISDIIKPDADNENLLTAMVNEGKVLYALSVLLPDEDIDNLAGYTPEQATWCKDNEKNIWQTIVKQNYLYSTDHMLITRLINDAASTSILSPQSPGRVGVWMGWQIVSQYAKKKGFLLEDILSMDAETILKGAKYNP
jgi:hypothetical protein